MTDDEILEGIAEVARRHVGWSGPLNPDLRLVEDLELDSLKLLTLAVEVENHFRVCLDPERDAELVTVADLVAAIRSRRES
jgi:acyl carrier protein